MKHNLIRIIHTGKSVLGWDDALYRQTLQRLTGKTSTTSCNLDELKVVKEYMHEAGFPRTPRKSHGRRPSVATSREAVLRKIEALLTDAGRPWQYAESMAKHMFKRETVIEWLTTEELTKLMQALVVDARRRAKRENNG